MKRSHALHPKGLALRLAIVLAFMALVASIGVATVFAATTASITATTSTASGRNNLRMPSSTRDTSGHVTIIVLDMSGSMGANDPNGYRCSAADAYIDLSGPNDYIGVIGLDNNNGQRGGDLNFQMAQMWSNPVNMATQHARQALKDTIKNKSNNCRPDNTTPTYDALNQAYVMLDSATKQNSASGSVILLTDGAPYPDADAQIAAITSGLTPKFQQRGWPIDTIGLGQDGPIGGKTPGTFHDFLSHISDATSGNFYDDGKGVVSGVSPLNIGPFFVQIFAHYSGYSVNESIPPTQLDGGTTSRNFKVIHNTQTLDIVVVKDQLQTQTTLLDSNNQPVSPDGVGIFQSTENYQDIYQIDQPTAGVWTANVTGSGKFILYSLNKTDIALQFVSVALKNSNIPSSSVLPLGQTLFITANLTANGQAITDNSFSVNGTISYAGGEGVYNQHFALDDNATPGTYVGEVVVPETAPAGSYNITLQASTVTVQNVASNVTKIVRLEVFPVPSFLSPQTHTLTEATIHATVVDWGLLGLLYNLPVLNNLSGLPLQGFPAQPQANLAGQVQWNGQAYAGANITAMAFNDQQKSFPLTVIQDGQGNFTVQFVPPASGHYRVVFSTSGTYKDSHGEFGQITRDTNVTVIAPAPKQFVIAVSITILYFLVLVFLIFLGKFWLTPKPFGEWIYDPGGESSSGRRFDRAHRGLFQWFFSRNILTSRQTGMPTGLVLRFGWGRQIEVHSDGTNRAQDWHFSDGRSLRQDYQRANDLIFSMGDEEGLASYRIETGASRSAKRSGSGRGTGRSSGGNGRYSTSGRSSYQTTHPAPRGKSSSRKSSNRGKDSASSWKDYYDV